MPTTLATPAMLLLSQDTGEIKPNPTRVNDQLILFSFFSQRLRISLWPVAICRELIQGFSDYHYNEAYREGGGYICPAQVSSSKSFNDEHKDGNISWWRFPKLAHFCQVAYGRVLRALSLSGAWKVVKMESDYTIKHVQWPLPTWPANIKIQIKI